MDDQLPQTAVKEDETLSCPAQRITSAVMVQITMVSRKTSMTPISPCSAGWSTCAAAWAMDAVPMPASLVKTPREMPMRKTAKKAAFGWNAPSKIARKAPGMASRRRISTIEVKSR